MSDEIYQLISIFIYLASCYISVGIHTRGQAT